MTTIADRGTGNYYFMENPNAFAAVFQKELYSVKAVAASSLEIRVPLNQGISVVDAAGYPVDVRHSHVIFHPGNLLSGQKRKLFLSLRIPTDEEGTFNINGISVGYRHQGQPHTVTLSEPLRVACVKDRQEVFASIDANEWEEKVIGEDYNKLKEEVALDIKKGKKADALKRIQGYYDAQQAVNATVGSSKVADNLDKDLSGLRETVEKTFTGSAGEVEHKQKCNAKAMQFEGYKGRRSK